MIPFRAWELYFDPNEFSNGNAVCRLMYGLIDTFRSHNLLADKAKINDDGYCDVDAASLMNVTEFMRMHDEEPENLIKAVGMAVSEVIYEREPCCKYIQARIIQYGACTPFTDLKAALVGKFIRVKGNVTRVSSVKPKIKQVSFFCQKCLGRFTARMTDGMYRIPFKCQINGCGAAGSKFLVPDRSDADTQCTSWQQLRIQEMRSDDGNEEGGDAGRVPRSIEVELEGTLVDSAAPGDSVFIGAIVKAADLSEGKAHTNPTYMVYLEASWIQRERDQVGSSVSEDEVVGIVSRLSSKDLLPSLISSFCPQIYGNDLVKFGILLTLFGGSTRLQSCKSRGDMAIRTDPHLLLVGDPGLGKSQLITAAASIAPRGIYVCGNTSTATGLTATLHHDGSSGGINGSGYTLEAGAMVLADTGVCCIDEFDKIGDQHRALLQVMEQQQVNVAKAGVVCSLPARTSVIAAANPVGGHYNRSKSLMANLKMEPALLSRFDLVFVLLDRPDSKVDRLLSDKVLGNFTSGSGAKGFKAFDDIGNEGSTVKSSLHARLTGGNATVISPSQLRQLVAFCRANIHPRMSPEAAEILQAFYLELRQQEKSGLVDDLLPITTRHLEAMIRLSESRARMEMRNIVEVSDAQDIIELMRHCLHEFLNKEPTTSTIPAKRGSKGTGRTSILKRFVGELIKVSANTGQSTFTEQQLRELHTALDLTALFPFSECIEALGQYGYVLKKGPGLYKLYVT